MDHDELYVPSDASKALVSGQKGEIGKTPVAMVKARCTRCRHAFRHTEPRMVITSRGRAEGLCGRCFTNHWDSSEFGDPFDVYFSIDHEARLTRIAIGTTTDGSFSIDFNPYGFIEMFGIKNTRRALRWDFDSLAPKNLTFFQRLKFLFKPYEIWSPKEYYENRNRGMSEGRMD